METGLFLQEISDAGKQQDPVKMMNAMQKFFSAIHNADHKNGTLLGIYSMAQQLESMGLNAQAIKNAVRARIASQYAQYTSMWKEAAVGLNALLDNEGVNGPFLKIKI